MRALKIKKCRADVFDVAAFILKECADRKAMTAWKLQKLVYYSQAWSLVWDDKPLFDQRIEAWTNGPVCPDLYEVHRGQFQVSKLPKGAPSNLTKSEKETIAAVLKHYGNRTPQYLSELTHQEEPWKRAREGLKLAERGNHEIKLDDMAEYYGGL